MTIMVPRRLHVDLQRQMILIEHYGLKTILEARISALAYRSGNYSQYKHRIIFDYYHGVAIEATPEELIERARVWTSTNGWQESLHIDTKGWIAEGRTPIITIPRWLAINGCQDHYISDRTYNKAFGELPDPPPTPACAAHNAAMVAMWEAEKPERMNSLDQPANGPQAPSVTS